MALFSGAVRTTNLKHHTHVNMGGCIMYSGIRLLLLIHPFYFLLKYLRSANSIAAFAATLYLYFSLIIRKSSYANNKGTNQPAHPRSLISAFPVRCLDSVIPCEFQNFKTLASRFCSAGRFESYLVATPEDRFSRDGANFTLQVHGEHDMQIRVNVTGGKPNHHYKLKEYAHGDIGHECIDMGEALETLHQ